MVSFIVSSVVCGNSVLYLKKDVNARLLRLLRKIKELLFVFNISEFEFGFVN